VSLAVRNPDRYGDLRIYGSEMSTRELLDVYNLISGEKREAKCLGSIEDLRNKKWEKTEHDMGMEILCSFLLYVYDGRGRLKSNNNSEFQEVKFLTVEEFLKNSQTKGFNYEFPISELSVKFGEICGK